MATPVWKIHSHFRCSQLWRSIDSEILSTEQGHLFCRLTPRPPPSGQKLSQGEEPSAPLDAVTSTGPPEHCCWGGEEGSRMNVPLLEKSIWEASDSATEPPGVTQPLTSEGEAPHCVRGTRTSPNTGKPAFTSANRTKLLLNLIFPIP